MPRLRETVTAAPVPGHDDSQNHEHRDRRNDDAQRKPVGRGGAGRPTRARTRPGAGTGAGGGTRLDLSPGRRYTQVIQIATGDARIITRLVGPDRYVNANREPRPAGGTHDLGRAQWFGNSE